MCIESHMFINQTVVNVCNVQCIKKDRSQQHYYLQLLYFALFLFSYALYFIIIYDTYTDALD